MKIKLSPLRSLLHDSLQLDNRSNEFIKSIERELNENIEISSIEDYECDLKLIYIETGGSEMLFKSQISKLREPYYFLTSGENNSLAATLEILTYLNKENLHGEILHGSSKYIADRIKQLANKKSQILLNKRYGVIGEPSDWLISSIPNAKEVEERFGATLVNIPLKELIDNFNNLDTPNNIDPLNFDKFEVSQAEKVYLSLKDIVSKYNLDGFTLRCFDLLSSIKTTGCLALAKFNKDGIIATCEGDVMAMLTMAIAKEIAGESSFQANPSRINVEDNTIVFTHCTIPLDMLTSYKYKTHFESGIGVAIKGELFEKEVTILRISSDMKRYFVSKGVILENLNEENLCRTQIKVKLDNSVQELLINPCGNHHIIFYGDYVDKIKQLLK